MSLAAIYDVTAPAKLNLFLHVVGRRPDGYHLLQSVFVLIDWCDTLHFERRSDGRLQRHDLGLALPADDLSLRAARALQQASATSLGADLSVQKRVPWGAGLGGGSSDAASTLLALNRLWGLNWSRQRLQQLALPLGADVPFFVGGHNAFVAGIGEQLTPLPAGALPPQRFAVVKPTQAIATAAIFGSPLLVRNTKAVILMSFLADAQQAATLQDGARSESSSESLCGSSESLRSSSESLRDSFWGFGRNDLQPPAEASCPAVTQVAAWLAARFGNSRMSGSGSAVFARMGAIDQPLGSGQLDAVPAGLPDGWVGRMCLGLDRHPLVDWAS